MDSNFKYRLAKQITLVCTWIGIGLCAEIVGPTLPDLKNRINTDYKGMSIVLGTRSIGMLIGSTFGGFIHEILYQHTDVLISLSMMLISISAIVVPWCSSLLMAVAAFFCSGFGEGVLNTGGNTMVMHLWPEKSTGPVHSLHFGFGFGALISPQIARNFLSNEPEKVQDKSTSKIEIPFAAVGCYMFIISLVFLTFYSKGPPEEFPLRRNSKKFKDMVSPKSCAPKSSVFGILSFTCLFFYFMHGVGGEKAYSKFLFSFAYESGFLDKNMAAVLQTVFWITYTLMRFLCIIFSKWISLNTMMLTSIFLGMLASCMLTVFAVKNVVYLWIFTVFMAAAIAGSFPNGMAWAGKYLSMNSVGVMVLLIGGSFGAFGYQYTTGHLFQEIGPHSLMYIMLVYAFGLGLIYSFMIVILHVFKPKLLSNQEEEAHSVDISED